MDFPFPWESLVEGGVTLILAAFIYAILTGRLVPASVVKGVRGDLETWRITALKREETLHSAISTLEDTLRLVGDTNQNSRLILDIVKELRHEGHAHVEDEHLDEASQIVHDVARRLQEMRKREPDQGS